jgi:hypothetical protein
MEYDYVLCVTWVHLYIVFYHRLYMFFFLKKKKSGYASFFDVFSYIKNPKYKLKNLWKYLIKFFLLTITNNEIKKFKR